MVSKFSDLAIEKLEDDKVGFKDYAEGIISTIEKVSEEDTPFTVAVFGAWGSGKTSLMQIIQGLLKSKGYKTIFFNSWEYGNEEKPWIPFMIQIVNELFGEKEKINKNELIRNIFLFSTDIVLQYYSQGKLSSGGILDLIKRSRKPTLFKEWTDEDVSIVIDRVTKIKEFKKKIKNRAENSPKKKIIIFIDDLDRIPERLIGFLNSLKTFLDIKGCIFILGCDYKILDNELKRTYIEKYLGESSEAIYEDYFDKIVQTEFYIPGISEQAIKGYLGFLTGWGEKEIEECTKLVIHSIGGNPRKIKRAVNATILIRSIFESKLITLLKEFERPNQRIKQEFAGNERLEEPAALRGEITGTFAPAWVFDILFDTRLLFKLVCMRERWYDLYESILSEEDKQSALVQGNTVEISELLNATKDKGEKLRGTKKYLPIFLQDRPHFHKVEDIKTYLTLLSISSPEAGISLEYAEPEKLPDNLFNRYMIFERINKGKVEEEIIEKKISQMDWESSLSSYYFFIEIIRAFGYDHLIMDLFRSEKNLKSITDVRKIKESRDLKAIGFILDYVNRIDEGIAKGLLNETKDTYADKIIESKNIEAIGSLLGSVIRIDEGIAKGLLNETKDTYANKIIDSKNIEAIGSLLISVNWIDKGIARGLLNETKDTFARKLRESKGLVSMDSLVSSVILIDVEIGGGLLNETKYTFAEKIRESKDPEAIGSLLTGLSESTSDGIAVGIDSRIVEELLNETKDTHAKKIRESKDLHAIKSLLDGVRWIDRGIAKGLLNETKDTYAEKIRESKDLASIGSLLRSVNVIDSGIAGELLNAMKDAYAEKIRESKNPDAIGSLLNSVNWIDNGRAKGLLNETKDTYAEKIRESKDLHAIESLLSNVNWIDNGRARELLDEIKNTIAEKIRESKDLASIGSLLRSVNVIDSGIARELLDEIKNTIAEKIRESKDQRARRELLDIVKKMNGEIADKSKNETTFPS